MQSLHVANAVLSAVALQPVAFMLRSLAPIPRLRAPGCVPQAVCPRLCAPGCVPAVEAFLKCTVLPPDTGVLPRLSACTLFLLFA